MEWNANRYVETINGEQCHPVNGSCLNDCDRGTYGVKCNLGNIVKKL